MLLTEMLEGFVYIESVNPGPLEDPQLQALMGMTFPELALSDELSNSVKMHSYPMLVGESRESGFMRLFGHFLEGASTVEIVDRYFAEKLVDNEDVVQWLIKQVASQTNCPIRIKSKMPRERFGEWGQKTLHEILASLANSNVFNKSSLGIQNDIYLDLYEKVPHNRYIRFQFSNGAVYCSIDHGVDAFKDDPVSEPEPVNEIPREVYVNIQSSKAWSPRLDEQLSDWRNPSLASDWRIFVRLPRRFASYTT
jgi:hypothetical protein